MQIRRYLCIANIALCNDGMEIASTFAYLRPDEHGAVHEDPVPKGS